MSDVVIRAITQDGEFRVIAADVTEAVRQALRGRVAGPAAVERFARAMVGTALIRAAVHPGERFQFHLRGVGPVADLRVDSWPGGGLRGYVQAHEDPQKDVPLQGQVYTVARTRALAGDEPYQSLLAVVKGDVTSEVERYLQHSAQIEASVSLDVSLDGAGGVGVALGRLVMPLPEATREDLAALVEVLKAPRPLRPAFEASGLEAVVAAGLPPGYAFAVVATEEQRHLCVCSPTQVREMLKSLGPAELRGLIADGEPVVVDCAYCADKRFEVSLPELAAMTGDLN